MSILLLLFFIFIFIIIAFQCKALYYCIKEAMEKSGRKQDAAELGGEFPIQDCASGEGGLIQVAYIDKQDSIQ